MIPRFQPCDQLIRGKIKLPWRRWVLYVTPEYCRVVYCALGGDAVVAGNLRLNIVMFVILLPSAY